VLLALVGLHLVVAALLPALTTRSGRWVWAAAALVPLATLVWALTRAGRVLDGGAVTERVSWAPALGLELSFRLDGLSLLMVGVVSGVGVAVLAYAAYYFRRDVHREAGLLLASPTTSSCSTCSGRRPASRPSC
jgi:multicomponent Na+:H+ antiporter subunit A